MAVTGYSITDRYVTNVKDVDIHLSAFKMDKIYVHDDQVGPFARMEIDNAKFKFKNLKDLEDRFSILSFWCDNTRTFGHIRAIPIILLFPLYHKIRIPFATILNVMIFFNAFIEYLKSNKFINLKNFIEWDIYLSTINDFKSEFFFQKYIQGSELKKILEYSLPHFIWRATGKYNNNPVIDFLFDATDIEQGNYLLHCIEYDKSICKVIGEKSTDDNLVKDFLSTPTKEIFRNTYK